MKQAVKTLRLKVQTHANKTGEARGGVALVALWMSGAIVSFSTMAIAGRAVSDELDAVEILLYRSIFGLGIVLAGAWFAGTLSQINARHRGLHLSRNLCHFSGQALWFSALPLLPLAQIFALEFTSPIWVLVLSPLILGEKLTRLRVGVALVGFVGILIVARPGVVTMNIGVVAAALSAVCFAGSIILTKRLTRTETLTCILFYLTAMQLVFGLVCAGFDGNITLPSLMVWPWLVLIGCAGVCAHFCLITALTLAPAAVVVPFDFIRLPAIAVVGLVFYDEALDIFVLIGAVVIFAANYANIWAETRQPPSNR